MASIIVTFSELAGFVNGQVVGEKLGDETYDGMDEALLPAKEEFPVSFVKRFAGRAESRWRVVEVRCSSQAGVPAQFEVVVTKAPVTVPEKYLAQHLRETSIKVNNLLFYGTLVEVDFGFAPAIASYQHTFGRCAGYLDQIQAGEMNKRRLAIVTTCSGTSVQVIPISTNSRPTHEKSSFQITTNLEHLVSYNNGKPSWAVCTMVQTVSTERVLAPISSYTARGVKKDWRDPKFRHRLNDADRKSLKPAVAHASGISDYDALRTRFDESETLAAELNDLRARGRRADVFEEVAMELLGGEDVRSVVEEMIETRIAGMT